MGVVAPVTHSVSSLAARMCAAEFCWGWTVQTRRAANVNGPEGPSQNLPTSSSTQDLLLLPYTLAILGLPMAAAQALFLGCQSSPHELQEPWRIKDLI